MMRAINLYSALNYAEKPTLFLEFGGSKAELEEQIRKVSTETNIIVNNSL
jgi:thiamine pyrophosphate-dependent acetolactate synthase large subunit-like protein